MQQYLYKIEKYIEYAWKRQIALLWVYKEAPFVRDGAFFVYSCLKEIEIYLYMYIKRINGQNVTTFFEKK